MSDDLTALEERFNLRLAAQLADVRSEMRTGFADARTEIADLRGDIEAKLRSQTWAMVTTLVSVSGLVFTLTRFT